MGAAVGGILVVGSQEIENDTLGGAQPQGLPSRRSHWRALPTVPGSTSHVHNLNISISLQDLVNKMRAGSSSSGSSARELAHCVVSECTGVPPAC